MNSGCVLNTPVDIENNRKLLAPRELVPNQENNSKEGKGSDLGNK